MNIQLTSGLSNRIRTLLGFRKKCVKENKILNVHWPKDKDCYCHFNDIFEPISNVKFNKTEPFHFIGQDTYQNIIKTSYEEMKYDYKIILVPKYHLRKIIDSFVEKNIIKNAIGIHIRRTDHISLALQHNKFSTDNVFHDFIRKHDENVRIFLATDNAETQQNFIDKYKDRLVIYKKIDKSIVDLRKTDIETAVIDIYISAKCKAFLGSGYSSYSGFIETSR
jgi:hypothetical protein